LFALQSVVITPTTGGSVNPQIRGELQSEADDILAVVNQNEDFSLSAYVRYWSQTKWRFQGAVNNRIGYGNGDPKGKLGTLLNETFGSHGRTYNLELRYRLPNVSSGSGITYMVYRGEPTDNAVVATERVTLYDNQTLTAANATTVELWQFDTNATNNERSYYPIPNAVDGHVYNVVEVRLVVW
jgi:hypothetical protein